MKTLQYLVFSVFLMVLSGCVAGKSGPGATSETDNIRYTKVNIHTQMKNDAVYNASYANYTDPGEGHYIIPAGSKIVITGKARKGFYFTFDNGGKKGFFEFHRPRMEMGLDEYLDIISSSQPVSFSELSPLDRQGVKKGKALIGMTRKGVMTALGYPATHRTPSLDDPTWTYWRNRFGTVAVEFNSNGKVATTRD